ncbi:DegV family protein [Lactobacillus sp. Sy-1]|uniref:DegV family protein n=1 Tax=Lactobacillus sp. Sy-1 TaxID=2109645 RepID=UPI001C59FAF8|nr:DegV family protein [Lactobacillus sp. Sy-1]MBW1605579.1 DegV family protein [Lactobacillus sp. Sy-1]
MKIAIVTDSTAYLSNDELAKYKIHILPISVIIDGQTYEEGVDIDTAEFYEKLQSAKNFPSTAQPAAGKIIELYDQLARDGYDTVISIHLASTISGLYNQLVALAPTIKNIKVIPYDSKITVKLMGYLAIAAAQMVTDGNSVDEILTELDALRATIDEIFVVDDLMNLVKGGRLSNAAGMVGSLLHIKPLLTFDDQTDKIVAFDKVRTRKRALKRAEEIFNQRTSNLDYPVRVLIINGNDQEHGQIWADKIKALRPDVKVTQSYFGPVIGAHLGNKSLALAWMRDFELK